MKLHIDFDSYFVNAQRLLNKELCNTPCVIYAGSDEDFFNQDAKYIDNKIAFMSSIEVARSENKVIDYRHFTAIAVSYEAKKYGVKVGDKLNIAYQKCPNLKIARSNIRFYKELSFKVRQFLESKIPVIEQFSIDEFFGDLEGFKKDTEVLDYAKYLQKELLDKFGLPASIGINNSKWGAKFLTDLAKPFGIRMEYDLSNAIKGIDIKNFAGIGREIQKYLRAYGVNTLDELLQKEYLLDKYGKNGKKIIARIKGVDNEKVEETKDIKSHAISKSFKPINDYDELRRRVKILARYLCVWISKHKYHPKKIEISIKYGNKLEHIGIEIMQPFDEKNLIDNAVKGFEILMKNTKNVSVYYIGIAANNLDKTYCENIFQNTTKNQKLNETLSAIRDKFGISCIKYGG
ncbi:MULTISPECIES: Y-family DNA polymerase [unclassified Campylobacter]|uniref:Y-family DNA polymerase n=1 Tax=unclassified Campylobacter TaxID=2593542 RepID=UPI001D3A1AF1|nr:hypothetical protein [Campylobacter sp. RM9331]MBZ8006357.1 hypothetical protein [Campylobacter sp. RM9332]